MSKIDRFEERISEFRRTLVEKLEEAERALKEFDAVVKTLTELKEAVSEAVFSRVFENLKHPAIERMVEEGLLLKNKSLSSPREIAENAREILLSVRRPLKRGEIIREFERAQIQIPGKDKNKNLGTIMWRHPKIIVALPGRGYWARGVPLPGIYDPETYDHPDLENLEIDSEAPKRVK